MNKLMSSIMPKYSTLCGVVKEIDLDIYVVTNSDISLKAKKAISCLIEPKMGDKVVLFMDDKEIYITTVLETKENATLEIVAKNDINIRSKNGDITLNAEQSINSFAQKANIVIEEVSVLSAIATLKADTISVIASVYQGLIDSVTLRYKTLNKSVDGHEEHQSISSRRVIKGSDIHQVDESITIAKGQVKIDAQQINMG